MGCSYTSSDKYTLITTCPSTSSRGTAQLSYKGVTISSWHFPTPSSSKTLTLESSSAVSDDWVAIGLPQTSN